MEEVIAGWYWRDLLVPLCIMFNSLLGGMALDAWFSNGGKRKMFGENAAREKENNAMLKELLAYMKKPAPGMMEDVAMLKEIAAGQAEFIRLLKAVVPTGMAAARVPPYAAAGSGVVNDTDGLSRSPVSFSPRGAPEWKK